MPGRQETPLQRGRRLYASGQLFSAAQCFLQAAAEGDESVQRWILQTEDLLTLNFWEPWQRRETRQVLSFLLQRERQTP